MSYFKEPERKNTKPLSDLDRVFSIFVEINNTSDEWDIHDNIVKAIKLHFGDFNGKYAPMIQELYEKIKGEPKVPMGYVTKEEEPILKQFVETTDKFKKLKI